MQEKNVIRTIVDSSLQEIKRHGREGFPLAVYEDDFAYFDKGYICWHWHEEFQISVVKQEMIEFDVAGKVFVLEPGDAVFINAQALHQIRPCRPLRGSIYCYIFKPAFLEHDVLSEIYRIYIQPVLKKRELCIVFKKKRDEKCLKLLDQIRYIYQEESYGYQLRIKGLLCELWYYMAKREEIQEGELSAREQRDILRVKEAIRYIDEKFRERVTLDELAGQVHISKSELCRCFGRVLHTTPMEYLIQHRVLEAARLLSDTDQSVTEIAVQTGFDSAGHMGRFFKKYIGNSPREFRKRGEKGRS